MTKTAIQVHPIRTEQDHREAVARISELMGAVWGSPEGDELDVLATLADAYEKEHFPIDPPDPITAIEFRMEQQGLSRKDLEPMVGSRARVSEVLTRKRPLTLGMIRRLNAGLGIPADVLIRVGTGPAGSGGAAALDSVRKAERRRTRVIEQKRGRQENLLWLSK